jgi:DNA mismatch repair protein MutS
MLDKVLERQDAVRFALEQSRFRDDLREALRRVPDMDRALSRLGLDRGGPRDLAAIRNGLTQAQQIADRHGSGDLPPLLRNAIAQLTGHDALLDHLDAALVAEPPLLARDGGFIAEGYDTELDEARRLRDEGRGVIAGMQADYARDTGIQSLKIKHNNVLGYFIEVTSTHADKMLSAPLNEVFKHRQTTANQLRFTTVPLSEMETKILNAGGRALEIEKRLYDSLKSEILDHAGTLTQTAAALAELDLATGWQSLHRRKTGAAPRWMTPARFGSRAGGTRSWNRPCAAKAARPSSPMIAILVGTATSGC